MANMSNIKTEMPLQDGNVRNKNFSEVTLGYTEEMAVNEANRCLECKKPLCVEGCPVNVQIPQFIRLIKDRKFKEAYLKITETNSLPAVCGRVCPQENQCEGKCIRAIKGESVGIGNLERFCADWYMQNCKDENQNNDNIIKKNKKVAVLGAGPSGLTCAGDLNKMGYDVTVFEAFQEAGGVLIYGIPEFRLPKNIVKKEIEKLVDNGVKIETNVVAGKTVDIDELFAEGYEAVFIGTGAGLPTFMNIEGEGLNGVVSANEYLTRINLMKAYKNDYDTPILNSKKVCVVGGGNVAMDAARCAKRLGAEVYIVYRRSEAEMPARKEEVHHAKDEDIIFKTLCNPIKIIGDENGNAKGIECIQMALGEPDASGRRSPVAIDNSNFVIDVDTVIMAIGTSPNPIIKNTTKDLETNRKGCIIADDNGKTSKEGVFAGGDAVTGAATVILAMGAGKKSAKAIDEYLSNK